MTLPPSQDRAEPSGGIRRPHSAAFIVGHGAGVWLFAAVLAIGLRALGLALGTHSIDQAMGSIPWILAVAGGIGLWVSLATAYKSWTLRRRRFPHRQHALTAPHTWQRGERTRVVGHLDCSQPLMAPSGTPCAAWALLFLRAPRNGGEPEMVLARSASAAAILRTEHGNVALAASATPRIRLWEGAAAGPDAPHIQQLDHETTRRLLREYDLGELLGQGLLAVEYRVPVDGTVSVLGHAEPLESGGAYRSANCAFALHADPKGALDITDDLHPAVSLPPKRRVRVASPTPGSVSTLAEEVVTTPAHSLKEKEVSNGTTDR